MSISIGKICLCAVLAMLAAALVSMNCAAQSNEYDGAVFSFTLTNGKSDEAENCFDEGEEIFVKTHLANQSAEMLDTLLTDTNYLYKSVLTRDGLREPIPYRNDRAELLRLREETQSSVGSQLIPDPMLPGESVELDTFKLSDRYPSLKPGSYKLSIEYKSSKPKLVDGVNTNVRLTQTNEFSVGGCHR